MAGEKSKEQRDTGKVRYRRKGGKLNTEQQSVFAPGSVGIDKTEAS